MNPNLEMLKLLDHFFQALDGFIDDYGVYLYLVFVWLSLLVIAWVLSGGMRKRVKRSSTAVIPGIIFTMQPPSQSPPPPIIGIEVDQTWNGDDETTD